MLWNGPTDTLPWNGIQVPQAIATLIGKQQFNTTCFIPMLKDLVRWSGNFEEP